MAPARAHANDCEGVLDVRVVDAATRAQSPKLVAEVSGFSGTYVSRQRRFDVAADLAPPHRGTAC